jgi:hypothetical protein
MCSFRWDHFQLEIRCLVYHFYPKYYPWDPIWVLFDWYSSVFERNNPHLTPNKYHIWNQHKKLSRLMCVSNGFFEVFFRSNFDPWSPSRICWKMILMKTSILLFSYLFFCLQVTFYKSRTSFLLFKQLFDQNHFSTYPWGGPGVKIW